MASLHPENKDVILFTGNYGSGKTEVAVNVASRLASNGKKVTIVDLDLVNPYFRCREARVQLEDLGVRVIAPKLVPVWLAGSQYSVAIRVLAIAKTVKNKQ